jgi:hypothetical protein
MSTATRRQKRLARRAARNAWMRCGGNLEVADAMFRDEMRMESIDPKTLMILLQIALMLWKWWQSQNIKEPSVVESSDEPIDWEDGEDD